MATTKPAGGSAPRSMTIKPAMKLTKLPPADIDLIATHIRMAISGIMKELKSTDERLQESGATTIVQLCSDATDLDRMFMARQGVITLLVELLGSSSQATENAALSAIIALCKRSTSNTILLRGQNDIVEKLVELMKTGNDEGKGSAAILVWALGTSEKKFACELATTKDLFPTLVNLLRARPVVAEKAVRTLWYFSLFDELLDQLVALQGLGENMLLVCQYGTDEAQAKALSATWRLVCHSDEYSRHICNLPDMLELLWFRAATPNHQAEVPLMASKVMVILSKIPGVLERYERLRGQPPAAPDPEANPLKKEWAKRPKPIRKAASVNRLAEQRTASSNSRTQSQRKIQAARDAQPSPVIKRPSLPPVDLSKTKSPTKDNSSSRQGLPPHTSSSTSSSPFVSPQPKSVASTPATTATASSTPSATPSTTNRRQSLTTTASTPKMESPAAKSTTLSKSSSASVLSHGAAISTPQAHIQRNQTSSTPSHQQQPPKSATQPTQSKPATQPMQPKPAAESPQQKAQIQPRLPAVIEDRTPVEPVAFVLYEKRATPSYAADDDDAGDDDFGQHNARKPRSVSLSLTANPNAVRPSSAGPPQQPPQANEPITRKDVLKMNRVARGLQLPDSLREKMLAATKGRHKR